MFSMWLLKNKEVNKMDEFFEDFDFGDLLGLGLAIGEELLEDEIERLRIEKEFDKDDEGKLMDDIDY